MYHTILLYLRLCRNRHFRHVLTTLWIKLKTNLSFRQIGSRINILESSEDRCKTAADVSNSVRQC